MVLVWGVLVDTHREGRGELRWLVLTLLVVSPTERGGLGNTVEWVGRRAGWYWWKGRSLLCKGVKEGGCWWYTHKQKPIFACHPAFTSTSNRLNFLAHYNTFLHKVLYQLI